MGGRRFSRAGPCRSGPPETFRAHVLALTTVTGLTGDNAIKGYISMVLGLMLSMVGFDLISGDARYTGGINEMLDVWISAVAIGLFGGVGAGERRAGDADGDPQRALRPA